MAGLRREHGGIATGIDSKKFSCSSLAQIGTWLPKTLAARVLTGRRHISLID
jgi:hypothetical protein